MRGNYSRVSETPRQGHAVNLTAYLLAWRTTSLPDREVIDALVHPAHTGPSPALAGALVQWPGSYYWSDEPDGRHLVLTRSLGRRRERWGVHVTLFLVTLLTTTFAGAVIAGTIPFDDPLALFTGSYPLPRHLVAAWSAGLPFSLPLLLILLCHELGHYVTARRYQIDVSPPYFIPVPLFPTFIGTMGAFIRLRSILNDRRQLFDVGLAGPIAGFVVAVPVLLVGLAASHPDPGFSSATGLILPIGGQAWVLGDSLVTLFARHLFHDGAQVVVAGPAAFAGWVGMFVTMLNLLPMGQLDGGHILFARLPNLHQRVALFFWLAIVALGTQWFGWYVWGGLVLLLSRGRLSHPPVLDAFRPLPRSRSLGWWVAVALFVITFAPAPLMVKG